MRLRIPRKQDRPVERPVLRLPLMREPEPIPLPKKEEATEEENPRGVGVVDFYI